MPPELRGRVVRQTGISEPIPREPSPLLRLRRRAGWRRPCS